MEDIQQKNWEFLKYYAQLQIIAADFDWNPLAQWNALIMGLSDETKDMFTYSNMPEELPVFVTVCQMQDNQIRQPRVDKAAQNTGRGVGFATP
jgi:hypothetical protein